MERLNIQYNPVTSIAANFPLGNTLKIVRRSTTLAQTVTVLRPIPFRCRVASASRRSACNPPRLVLGDESDQNQPLRFAPVRFQYAGLLVPSAIVASNRPAMPSTAELPVVLYTRRGCHLCDDAKLVLEQFGLRPREVDIDQQPDAELKARYDHWVPVVEINGKERFRGGVDPTLLRRILLSEKQSP